jgi:hypothetical protein
VNSLDFAPMPNDAEQSLISDDNDEDEFDPMLNIQIPDFYTRMRLYLKPKDGSLSLMLILLMADTVLAIIYITA